MTAYEDAGYLPEAMLNYLARLGWSHGDEEIFSREQMVEWFDGSHLSRSPAQWDPAKLDWVNAHYLKARRRRRCWRRWSTAQLARRGIDAVADARLRGVRALQGPLHTDRRARRLAGDVLRRRRARAAEDAGAHVTDAVRAARSRRLRDKLAAVAVGQGGIAAAIKETLAEHGLKMPQLAPAVRVLVCGRAQTPSLDAVLELFPRETVLARLRAGR